MASPEHLLVNAVITSGNKNELNRSNFTSDNMAKYRDEMFFIMEHKNVPSKKTFKAKFPYFVVQSIPSSDIYALIAQCKDNKIKQDVSVLLVNCAKSMQNGDSPSLVLDRMEKKVREIGSQFGNIVDINIMDNMEIYFRRYLEKRDKVNKGSTIGVPYGIKTVDSLTGGMQAKELITIAARTKVGKTWLMCKMAATAIQNAHSSLYLSLEMDWDAIANRVFSIISYEIALGRAKSSSKKKKSKDLDKYILHNNELNLAKISEKKVAKILKEIKEDVKASLYVPDIRGKFGISASQKRIEMLEPDCVFFDYFGLTQQNSTGKGVENWVQASEASRLSKEIARIYDIPFILGAQINRTGAAAEVPKLEHISLTDSIGQDSDKVYILKETGRRNRLQMICEKFRGSYDNWRVELDFDVNVGKLNEIRAINIQGEVDEDEF